mmetsp:Transcript_18525/g.37741  ORF Transcript_18525/g.37741 Transcript_18525/m.37741 type:complete len:201 (-) Transcript_18525:18-620(-)
MPRPCADRGGDSAHAGRPIQELLRGTQGHLCRGRDLHLLHGVLDDGGARDPLLLHPVPHLRGPQEGVAPLSRLRHDSDAGRNLRLDLGRDLIRGHHASRCCQDTYDARLEDCGWRGVRGHDQLAAHHRAGGGLRRALQGHRAAGGLDHPRRLRLLRGVREVHGAPVALGGLGREAQVHRLVVRPTDRQTDTCYHYSYWGR